LGAPNPATVDLPLPLFGGKVSLYDPQTLPPGASPANQDVIFPPGSVATRPGLNSFFAATLAGNPTVNYLKTFSLSHSDNRVLELDGLGNFYAELVAGVLTQVVTQATVPGSFGKSVTAFNKEYIAFGDGNYGIGIPMQYDGTNFDRVSQVGPGAGPAVASYVPPSVNIVASPSGLIPISEACSAFGYPSISIIDIRCVIPTGLVVGDTVTISGTADYNGNYTVAAIYGWGISVASATASVTVEAGTVQFNIVTVTTSTTYTTSVGASVPIAAATNASYDGTWIVQSVTSGTVFTAKVTSANTLAASGGGNIPAGSTGSIPTGLRGVSVSFITRQGYYTKPSVPVFISLDGTHALQVTHIPIGPANVIGRVLMITTATGATYYILPQFYIPDNTTTSVILNFLDTTLASGTDATSLFNLIELGECAAVTSYASRLFWAGERNKINNFLNLTFDGGWSLGAGNGGSDVPLGWMQPVVLPSTVGGSKDSVKAVWGDAYRITGDGVSAVRGEISQTAFQDYLGVRIIKDYTAISARVRLIKGGGIVQGQFVIDLFSPSLGQLGQLTINLNQITTTGFTEIIGPIMGSGAIIPSDLTLRVYMQGTPTNGGWVTADCIQIFPTAQPFLPGQVRASYALGNSPLASVESYNVTTGTMNIGDNYGEIAKTFFKLLDNKLYIAKELSVFTTQDDGKNEPSLWTVSIITDTVGTFAVNGVDSGEGWAVLADHTGAYICDGGVPIKISQEIQPDWDTINWAQDQTAYVVVDRQKKRIHIGVPTGASAIPNQEFVCDYSQLNDAQEIISHPQAYYSTFAPGKIIAPGKARKWTIWNVSAYCANQCVRNDGTVHLLRGNSAGTGKTYDELTTNLSDDGVAINSFYQTYYFPDIEQEQMLQLSAHRKHFEYLTLFVYGSGAFTTILEGPQGQRNVALKGIPVLANPEEWDDEMNVNWEGERASFLFGTNAVGAAFTATRFCPSVSKSLVPVRGRT
jgi:hypothetical protein